MAEKSGLVDKKLFVRMWVGDQNENDLDYLNAPSGRGYHFIKIFPGPTNKIDVEVEGRMPQQPPIVSFQGGVYFWNHVINSICNGCPDTASREIHVLKNATLNGVRLQCSSIRIRNSWGNNWQPISISNFECTFDVR